MPKRVYLSPSKDPDALRHSRHHTVYMGDGAEQEGTNARPLHKVEFFNGEARNIEESTYRRLVDAGIASTTRPSAGTEEEED